jgi:hypothetical protein
MTLIQAQQRYINRVLKAHPGHVRRVIRAAWKELYTWAAARGMDAAAVCTDAHDMCKLETMCED